jgi:hypothetical protein
MIVLRKLPTSSPYTLKPNLKLGLEALEIQKPPKTSMDSQARFLKPYLYTHKGNNINVLIYKGC